MGKEELVHKYVSIPISDKKMSKFLYAIFMVKGEISLIDHLGLERYDRKQNSGNMVSVVIKLKESKVTVFEELAEVKLQTSDEFQGRMTIN